MKQLTLICSVLFFITLLHSQIGSDNTSIYTDSFQGSPNEILVTAPESKSTDLLFPKGEVVELALNTREKKESLKSEQNTKQINDEILSNDTTLKYFLLSVLFLSLLGMIYFIKVLNKISISRKKTTEITRIKAKIGEEVET